MNTTNSEKKPALFANSTLEVSLLFDINSGKCLTFIGRTFPKVSPFFCVNSEKNVIYCLILTLLKCLNCLIYLTQYWLMFALKKSLLFDGSCLQLSTLFIAPNKCVLLLGGNSPKVLLLFRIRSLKKLTRVI